jgi:hypothetical protein
VKTSLTISAPAQGYHPVVHTNQGTVDLTADVTEINLPTRTEPLQRRPITVRTPKGLPAAGVEVLASTYAPRGSTDGEGHAEIIGPASTAPAQVYVMSRDGSLGTFAIIPSERMNGEEKIELQLRPTRTMEVEIQDEKGQNAAGWVGLMLAFDGHASGSSCASASIRDNAGDMVARFQIVPNMGYVVQGSTRGGEPAALAPDAKAILSFNETDPIPRQVLRFKRTASPVVVTPQAAYEKELQALKDALWSKEDPVQKSLTWYALKDGFAFADSNRKEVKRFTEILGETHWMVSGIAFGRDKVWLGADKGVLAWDRKDRFWSRFAVGGFLIDAPVGELSLSDAGILKVTIEEQGKPATAGTPARAFEYDVNAAKWRELK